MIQQNHYVLTGTVKRTDTGDKRDVEAFVKTIPNRQIEHETQLEVRLTAATKYINGRIEKIEKDIKRLNEYVQPPIEGAAANQDDSWNGGQTTTSNLQPNISPAEMEEIFGYRT